MSINHAQSSRGFSLVEVLVSLAVFSAVLSLVLFGLEQGRLSWMRGNTGTTFLSELSHRQFWLERMFMQANPATFEVDYGTESSFFLGSERELSFLSDAPVIGGPGTYAYVRLVIEPGEQGKQSLMIYEWDNRDPYLGLPEETSQPEKLIILKDIKDAYWEYLLDARTTPTPLETILDNFKPRYNDKWVREYDARFESVLPRKIRLSFKVKKKLYVWTFRLTRYSYAAGQNEPLVFQ